MSTESSRLQLIITKAYDDLRRGTDQASIIRVRRTSLLVLGSRLGRRATVNGRPLLQSSHLAVKDALGAPMIVREKIRHLGVFPAVDGTLVSITAYECYVLVRGCLRPIDEATYGWLLRQQRIVSDLERELRQPRSAARMAAN
jgi:hypothetical protein